MHTLRILTAIISNTSSVVSRNRLDKSQRVKFEAGCICVEALGGTCLLQVRPAPRSYPYFQLCKAYPIGSASCSSVGTWPAVAAIGGPEWYIGTRCAGGHQLINQTTAAEGRLLKLHTCLRQHNKHLEALSTRQKPTSDRSRRSWAIHSLDST